MLIWRIFLVGIGGMLGSICRYLLGLWLVQKISSSFPWGTFAINVIGSFCIGVLMGWPWKSNQQEHLQLLLATGFCGGFTTFSTFSFESFILLKQGQHLIWALYAFSSLVLSLIAVFVGVFISRLQ